MAMYILMIIVMVGMFWFMNRSQRKQQKERQNLLDTMKVGDSVVTIGGLHGVLSEIDEVKKTVTIDCEGIYLEFERGAIRTVKPAAAPETEASIEEPAQEPEKTEEKDSE